MSIWQTSSPGHVFTGYPQNLRLKNLWCSRVPDQEKKTISSIILWALCFAKYIAAMAKQFPDSTPGFMSHMLTMMKTFHEVEEPDWRQYDKAHKEKMASRAWSGMDVARSYVGTGQGGRLQSPYWILKSPPDQQE